MKKKTVNVTINGHDDDNFIIHLANIFPGLFSLFLLKSINLIQIVQLIDLLALETNFSTRLNGISFISQASYSSPQYDQQRNKMETRPKQQQQQLYISFQRTCTFQAGCFNWKAQSEKRELIRKPAITMTVFFQGISCLENFGLVDNRHQRLSLSSLCHKPHTHACAQNHQSCPSGG